MAFKPSQWTDLAGALGRPKQRHQNDQSTLKDFNWSKYNNQLPNGLELQWLGTAGFRFSYQGFTLLVDPYFTRPSLKKTFSRSYLQPEKEIITQHLDSADAIVVGHTHFDHALDVPAIVQTYGCKVYGSSSLFNLLKLYKLEKQASVVTCKKTYEMGPFEVTFIESIHSKLLLGLAVPSEGELCCEHLDHLGTGQYKCGQVYGIHIKVADTTFYHQGSANLIDDNISYKNVDYFLAGISGRSFTNNYAERILKRLSPGVVIPHHFDNFFTDIDKPLEFILNVNLGLFVDEVEKVSKDFDIRTLEILQTIKS